MKNKKTATIELVEFQDFLSDNETTYAYHRPSSKILNVSMNGNIKIYKNGECVWQTTQPYSAIEKYNEL